MVCWATLLFLFTSFLVLVDGYLVAKYEGLRPIRKELERKTVEFLGDTIIIPWSVTGLASMIVLADNGKLDFVPPEMGVIMVLVWFSVIILMIVKIQNAAPKLLGRLRTIVKLNALGNAIMLLATFKIVCENETVVSVVSLTIPVVLYLLMSLKFAETINKGLKEASPYNPN